MISLQLNANDFAGRPTAETRCNAIKIACPTGALRGIGPRGCVVPPRLPPGPICTMWAPCHFCRSGREFRDRHGRRPRRRIWPGSGAGLTRNKDRFPDRKIMPIPQNRENSRQEGCSAVSLAHKQGTAQGSTRHSEFEMALDSENLAQASNALVAV